MQDAAISLLAVFVFPLWVAAGFADWACHVRTGIAVTSGLKENALHWLMHIEIGLGIAAVVLLDLDAAVLAIVFAVFVAHEATVYWDLDYSTMRRDVGPFEQMVHSFLELLPLLSIVLLVLAAWPQALAIVHAGGDVADWSLRPRAVPIPLPYLEAAVGASLLFNGLPLLQETWSCWRNRPRREPAEPERVEPRL